jgi:hypothetical protein
VGRPGEVFEMDFDLDAIDQSPRGFSFGRTGSGRVGLWLVKTEKGAPSGPHVLAQFDSDSTSNRFPVAVVDAVSLRDILSLDESRRLRQVASDWASRL